MSVSSFEIIARTVTVLEEVCLLLDNEIDERTSDPVELPADALTIRDALDSTRALIPKLHAVRDAMASIETLQPDLWLTDGD